MLIEIDTFNCAYVCCSVSNLFFLAFILVLYNAFEKIFNVITFTRIYYIYVNTYILKDFDMIMIAVIHLIKKK